MMTKEKLRDLISVFYRNTFKIFYINSQDGETFTKPLGMFISLGITTSPIILENIKDVLESNGYNATISEISSKRFGGQFLNTVTTKSSPNQYELTEFDDNILDRTKATSLLKELKDEINQDQDLEVLKQLVPKVARLEELINKLDRTSGWDLHLIQRCISEESKIESFNIFHKFVNYKQVDGVEYRLGIYVSESSN
jgi:hypothetical protein